MGLLRYGNTYKEFHKRAEIMWQLYGVKLK